jgi:hypothetical protein
MEQIEALSPTGFGDGFKIGMVENDGRVLTTQLRGGD